MTPSSSTAPSPERREKLLRVFAEYKEGFAGAALAIVIEVVAIAVGHSAVTALFALSAAVTGYLLTVMRRSIQLELLEHTEKVNAAISLVEQSSIALGQVSRMSQIIDLNSRTNVSELINLHKNYFNIVEPEFSEIKSDVIKAASAELERMASQKSSKPLATGEYYEWLWDAFERYRPRKSHICAISTMLDAEWDTESAEEQRFISENVQSATAGCVVERIFIMPRDLLAKALENPYVREHATTDKGKPQGFVVFEEDIKKKDPALRQSVKDGFLCFDNRVMLLDDYDEHGSARGTVVMNPHDVGRLLKAFRTLKGLATPLSAAEGLVIGSKSSLGV